MENDERLEDTWYGQHEANRREVYIENIPQVWREPIITNIQADLPPRCDKGLSGVKRRTAICALRTRVCALHTCASLQSNPRETPLALATRVAVVELDASQELSSNSHPHSHIVMLTLALVLALTLALTLTHGRPSACAHRRWCERLQSPSRRGIGRYTHRESKRSAADRAPRYQGGAVRCEWEKRCEWETSPRGDYCCRRHHHPHSLWCGHCCRRRHHHHPLPGGHRCCHRHHRSRPPYYCIRCRQGCFLRRQPPCRVQSACRHEPSCGCSSPPHTSSGDRDLENPPHIATTRCRRLCVHRARRAVPSVRRASARQYQADRVRWQGAATVGHHKGQPQGSFTRGIHKGQPQGAITRGNHKGKRMCWSQDAQSHKPIAPQT